MVHELGDRVEGGPGGMADGRDLLTLAPLEQAVEGVAVHPDDGLLVQRCWFSVVLPAVQAACLRLKADKHPVGLGPHEVVFRHHDGHKASESSERLGLEAYPSTESLALRQPRASHAAVRLAPTSR